MYVVYNPSVFLFLLFLSFFFSLLCSLQKNKYTRIICRYIITMSSRLKYKVIHRDGRVEPFDFGKIITHLDNLCNMQPEIDISINPQDIAMEIVKKIADSTTTDQIDDYSAELCAAKLEHPDYLILAARITVSAHTKNLRKYNPNLLFSHSIEKLATNTDLNGNLANTIDPDFYNLVIKHKDIYDNMIDLSRDYKFDFFGFKTLMKSYLAKVNIITTGDGIKTIKSFIAESPQFMYLRVAICIHRDSFEKVQETYDMLSLKIISHATPTLFNAGMAKGQLLSCFLLGMEDSLSGIYKCLSDTAAISKLAGGIGINISDIRATGTYIKGTNGQSDGILPMLRVFNETSDYVNQGGKRKGSIAMYIEPWHADIYSFLEAKLPRTQSESRATSLFYALWIPDLFMTCVEKNEPWYLMCPHDSPGLTNCHSEQFNELYISYVNQGRYKKKIMAVELFNKILTCQRETGTPYMAYKDSINRKNNHMNLGIIKSSNLCVAPETRILTSEGYFPIVDLVNQDIKVWNGEKWSKTRVLQTGTDQKLLKVTLSNGSVIHCTEYHKFYIADTDFYKIIDAQNLEKDMILIDFKLPNTDCNPLFCEEYFKTHEEALCKLLTLQEAGVKSTIRKLDNEFCLQKDLESIPIKVISVEDINRYDNTYCFTESERGMGMFEGVLTGQCIEIVEYSDTKKYACCCLGSIILQNCVDYDTQAGHTSAHVYKKKKDSSLEKKKKEKIQEKVEKIGRNSFNFDRLQDAVRVMTRNLDTIIDLNYYPVPETRASNMSERPIGIGVQGLGDTFFALGLPFDSQEARELNRKIFEAIYYAAVSESIELAQEKGTYETYEGSPMSKGLLQFDMWSSEKDSGFTPVTDINYDWTNLKSRLKKYGLRNSMLTACMPTASTAQIAGTVAEAIEPITDHMYTRAVGAGNYSVINHYLINDIRKLSNFKTVLKLLKNNKISLQDSDIIPKELKDLYKTAFDIRQKVLIDLSADRGPFIDQTQSLNLFFDPKDEDINKKLGSAHMYGFKRGLKTGSYYIRSKATAKTDTMIIDKELYVKEEDEDCDMCGA